MTKRRLLSLLAALSSPLAAASTGTEKNLYQDSIQATKQSIAQETLGVFYHDALDYYNNNRYEDALQVLDKIYSIDPHYSDAARLRETIRRKQHSMQQEMTLETVKDWMRKGESAEKSGQRVLAVSYWKQALQIDPHYAPAAKKILEVNQALAKKEFEAGYIHYHHSELDDALESWSNAIALDPTYKQRGLLLLMSKVELRVRRDHVARLTAQGFEQYQQGQFEESLKTYDELSRLEPRHEEARRMTAKIKNQIGQAALKAAQAAMANRAYPEAITQADKALQYNYEVSRSSAIKGEALHAIKLASMPKPAPKPKPKPAVVVSTPTAPVRTPAAGPAGRPGESPGTLPEGTLGHPG